jgi:hypothetical protein
MSYSFHGADRVLQGPFFCSIQGNKTPTMVAPSRVESISCDSLVAVPDNDVVHYQNTSPHQNSFFSMVLGFIAIVGKSNRHSLQYLA